MTWFRQHFNEDYPILYQGRDQAQADTEVEFALKCLRVRPGEPVLDLCCGFGRHLLAFARHDVRAIGVDLSPALLARVPRTANVTTVCADMRRLPFRGAGRGFAVLVNFFTSFGYFQDDAENSLAAREAARVLRPGGRFLLDLMNPQATLKTLQPRSERRSGRFTIFEERQFDAARRRIEKKISLYDERSRETRSYFESVRVYDKREIQDLLHEVGLIPKQFFGDFQGSPVSPDAPRLIVTGQRVE